MKPITAAIFSLIYMPQGYALRKNGEHFRDTAWKTLARQQGKNESLKHIFAIQSIPPNEARISKYIKRQDPLLNHIYLASLFTIHR